MPVDLRSDTLTKPSAAMRRAMADAEVGDDVYGEDPTVNALERDVAGLFGHEAALFCPSGSMANQIAVQLLAGRGDELLTDSDAHVVTYEGGAAAAYGGVSTRTWPTDGGRLDADVIARYLRPAGYNAVGTRAVAVENTHNRGGGRVHPLAELRRVRDLADAEDLGLHCDGARIWNAHVADAVPLRDYGRLFDTMSVCLSKGLGAPVGSLVIADAEKIAAARVIRKRLGGGMRQVGVLAAAGRYALEHNIERLAEDHERARALAEAVAPFGVCEADEVRTNIVPLDVPDMAAVAAAAAEDGVLVSVLGPDRGRLVTHLGVSDEDVDRAVKVLPEVFDRLR